MSNASRALARLNSEAQAANVCRLATDRDASAAYAPRMGAAAPPVPATEIRLFAIGVNETEKGAFIVDADDAKGIVEQWLARGTDLSWDYAHSETVENTTGLPRIAGAWSKLELRDDGVWATEIQWTERCLQLIAALELRYWSPFFDTCYRDHGDGLSGCHVVNIINVGITNIPATHGIPAIAASATAADAKTAQPTARASGRLTAILAATAQGKKPMTLAEMVKQLAGDITKAGAKGDLSTADMVSLLGALPQDVPDDKEEPTPASAGPDSDEGPDSDDDPDSEEDASAKAARAAVAALDAKKAQRKALAANGPPTSRSAGVAKAAAAVNGRQDKDGENAALRAALAIQKGRVDTIEKNARTVEFANVLASGRREGKVTPAQAASEDFLSIFDGSPSKLRKYLASATVLVNSKPEKPGALPDVGGSDLNAAEKAMCLANGIREGTAAYDAVKKHLSTSRAALARRSSTTEQELAMTALTAGKQVNVNAGPLPQYFDWPVLAAVKIYPGAGVVIDSGGFAKPAVTATGLTTCGVAQELADNSAGASGDIRVRVRCGVAGPFVITGLATADAGRTVLYWTDDQTVTTTSTGRSIAGICMPHPSGANVSTEAYVALTGPGPQAAIGTNSALSGNTPVGPGTGAAGAASDVSKSDHVHPPAMQEFRIQDAAAGTATTETILKRFAAATTISAVAFEADASVTQSDTDYATITLKQGDGAGGARSTVVSFTTKVTAGKNLVAFTAADGGALTNAVVPAGGIVTLTVTKTGAGQALKGLFTFAFS